MHADIAIVGGGVASAAAVLALRDIGRSIIVVAPTAGADEIIGESLSPSANPILQDLGIWDDFMRQEHRHSAVNFSAWGSQQLVQRDFSNHPAGVGWSLDRRRFEDFLWNIADQIEHTRLHAKLRTAEKTTKGWKLQISDNTTIDARFVIDCSGRACKFARHLTDRQSDQKMVSAFSFLDQIDTGIEPTRAVMIEARPNGWWYSALTPSNRLVICFFSDSLLLPSNLRQDTKVWKTLVKSAPYTWRRVTTAGFEITRVPDIMDAGSRYLTCFADAKKNWAAAGDAAAVFDPLSSHGLTTALWSGRKAALAANAALDNDYQPIHQYVEAFTEGVNHYRQELKTFYWREHRFPNEPFWRDRQKDP